MGQEQVKNKPLKTLTNGILNENPIFKLVLGTCPTLAVTTSAINGVGMGLSTMVVLSCSNAVISMLRKFIPEKVRIPAYVTVIATFVTIVQLLLKAFVPALDKSLGIYIPLIVVNCIILARAEAFASKQPVISSLLDGVGMGLGFTVGLTLIGSAREIIGNGSIFGIQLYGEGNVFASQALGTVPPMLLMVLPPGGFIAFGLIMAWANKLKLPKVDLKKKVDIDPTEGGSCAGCAMSETCGAGGGQARPQTPARSTGKADQADQAAPVDSVAEEEA